MHRVLPLLGLLALSAEGGAGQRPAFDFAAVPTLEQLRSVKFLPVPGGVTAHRFEERGFVAVPMDYARRGESPTLRIFYRLMPARGSAVRDTRAPIVVVVNGGPGAPSSFYRPYDYDYEHPTEQTRKKDLLGVMLSRFRVLILDQRGTPGYSAPLDMSDPHLSPAIVARYFDSAHQALDHQEVIRAVIPENEPFYMIAQSYAGMIGMRYLTLPAISRQPRGIVFSSAALPHGDAALAMESRRREQRALNLQLRRAEPRIEESLARLRAHFARNGFDPGSVNYLWTWLGKGPAWEAALVDELRSLLRADRRGLQTFLDEEADKADLLNYILSAKELTPGFTDRTLAVVLVKRVPFEEWMLDEEWTLLRLQGDAGWIGPMLDALDRNPPPVDPPFPPMAEIRERLAGRYALFTLAKGDAFIGEEVALERRKQFAVEGRTRIEILPGGHQAAFLEAGVAAIASWIGGLPRR
jgi:hypothetical protein